MASPARRIFTILLPYGGDNRKPVVTEAGVLQSETILWLAGAHGGRAAVVEVGRWWMEHPKKGCRPGRAKGRREKRMDKVASLKEILEQDAKNAFARYGLAMEYAGRGETDAALAEFARLLEDHPDYTAGYFMAAQTLEKAGLAAEAKQKLVDGMASARRTGNQHAAREMQAMLDEMEMAE